MDDRFDRIGLAVHPRRELDKALASVRDWAERQNAEVVQVASLEREVAPPGDARDCDLVIALGGDGTTLAALHAAAPVGRPVLGVACGSLGALTAVDADRLHDALERVRRGDWTALRLPAIAIHPPSGHDEWAVNDFVVVRRGAGQALVDLYLDDELYVRLAGDGLVVASPLGSSAYSMASGGPLIAPGALAFVCTPLAMHGGNAPPLVVPATSTVRVVVHPSFAGFDIEIDGHRYPLKSLDYRLSLYEGKVTLVTFGKLSIGLSGLRRRRLVTDSPRVLARDDRTDRG